LAPSVQPPRALGLYAFIFGVAALALAAGVAAVRLAAEGPPPPAPRLGQAIPTSFGVISVDQVERLAASNPDRRKLAPEQSELQIALTTINVLDRSVPYSRDQVSLRLGRDGAPIPVKSASIHSGKLKGSTAFRSIFRFVVPNGPSELWVAFRDPSRSRPILIELGSGPFPVGLSSAYNRSLHGVGYSHHQQGAGP
jgi:hypothetical protein